MSNTQIGRTPVKTLVSQPFRMRTLKGFRKLAFWLFVISIFMNWGFVGAVSLIAWVAMWSVSLLF